MNPMCELPGDCRVLLVGNGPSALSMEVGEEIDLFPTVLRFNAFRTKGYEKYVGSRTDIYVTTCYGPHPERGYDFKEIYLSYKRKGERHFGFERARKGFPGVKVVPIWAWRITQYLMGGYGVSTGLTVAVWFAMEGWKVWIYGFDFFEGIVHHYSDNSPRGDHDTEREMGLMRKLRDDGLVRVFKNYHTLEPGNK